MILFTLKKKNELVQARIQGASGLRVNYAISNLLNHIKSVSAKKGKIRRIARVHFCGT